MPTDRLLTICLCALFSFSVIGCGGGGDAPSIEDAPPTPEAGSDEYESYNNAGQGAPGSNDGAAPSGN